MSVLTSGFQARLLLIWISSGQWAHSIEREEEEERRGGEPARMDRLIMEVKLVPVGVIYSIKLSMTLYPAFGGI